jgi:hypothetical protein
MTRQWLTMTSQWLTMTRQWLTMTRQWLTMTRQWLTMTRLWLTMNRQWLNGHGNEADFPRFLHINRFGIGPLQYALPNLDSNLRRYYEYLHKFEAKIGSKGRVRDS